MTLTIHRNTAVSLIVTGPGPEIMAALRTPETQRLSILTTQRCIRERKATLPGIRALRHLTGDRTADWCRGEDRYVASRGYALAQLRKLRTGLIRERAELARLIARDRALADAQQSVADQIADATDQRRRLVDGAVVLELVE